MTSTYLETLRRDTDALKDDGLFKTERVITSPQDANIAVTDADGQAHNVINLCANNYLGLANHPALIEAGKAALDRYGFGMASVRFICGTQSVHKELEAALSDFLGTEDTILYPSCFDANGGLFETLLGPDDAVISDALNHASIIDGIRLCKAQRHRFAHNDMADLEEKLKSTASARTRLIATDGVFSMDGTVAQLDKITQLAERYDAMIMMDDCHATGFLGSGGRGTHEYHNVVGKIDLLTGTLGKALGGAAGGYISGHQVLIDWLRQRSRPYLFSNTLAPVIAATSLKVLDMIRDGNALREQLIDNTRYFRTAMTDAGFTLLPGDHPIVPVMLGSESLASDMADRLLAKGLYVIGFSFPVVPRGQARIRTQMCASHTRAQLEQSVQAFIDVGRELGVIEGAA
ncbi:MAG: glycine C-acetyltransferase [Gammaproteobacteria bacterium]